MPADGDLPAINDRGTVDLPALKDRGAIRRCERRTRHMLGAYL